MTTDLNPAGPPEILQVLLSARVTLGTGGTRTLTQLAYGSHPDINDSSSIDDLQATVGPVTAAIANSNKIRVVFDELLVGNNLEEIACADGTYSQVPRGTTPDDIAKCSGAPEDIASTCVGEHAVCIGSSGPVGILDQDNGGQGDGAVDDLRLIDGVVTLTCDGVQMPVHRDQSFYQPSGNQLISAGPLGVDSLGPALVIVPNNEDTADLVHSGMRTGSSCSLSLSSDVVDKDGNQSCAPAGGPDENACVPGDISGISWTTEPLRLAGQTPNANATNVALGNPDSRVLLQFNAAIDDTTVSAISLADESGTFADCASPAVAPCIQRTRASNDPTLITVTVVGGFTPDNQHTVTIGTGLTDGFGGALPAEVSFTFTTRTATPTADAGADAMPADADIDAL